MVQEFLNCSDAHLWAILTNGTRLRLLRDSTALAGSAYLEFDLEAIFDGELYPEFLLLFTLAHSSRTEIRRGSGADGATDEAGPADCWLEDWRTDAGTPAPALWTNSASASKRPLTALVTASCTTPTTVGWSRRCATAT